MSKTLKIEKEVYETLETYVDLCPTEISGLGRITLDKDNDFILSEVALFEQEVSGAHSDISAAALAQFQADTVKKGGSMREWVCWWHSHATMGVFWSKRDTNTMEESTEFPFLVSLVMNKKGESKARVDYSVTSVSTFGTTTTKRCHDDLDVTILYDAIDKKIITKCKKEIKAKVREPVRIPALPANRQAYTGLIPPQHYKTKSKKGKKKGKHHISNDVLIMQEDVYQGLVNAKWYELEMAVEDGNFEAARKCDSALYNIKLRGYSDLGLEALKPTRLIENWSDFQALRHEIIPNYGIKW